MEQEEVEMINDEKGEKEEKKGGDRENVPILILLRYYPPYLPPPPILFTPFYDSSYFEIILLTSVFLYPSPPPHFILPFHLSPYSFLIPYSHASCPSFSIPLPLPPLYTKFISLHHSDPKRHVSRDHLPSPLPLHLHPLPIQQGMAPFPPAPPLSTPSSSI